MEYRNKLVLAPMVRVGTLPFRMLAAQYGADITYGEEIIDHKIIKCERRVNDVLGTTDILEKGTDNVVFRTCPEERNRVVFQMGTSDAMRALKAAEIVCKDVAAIDVNMGCPKSFSISGGMGAALLSKPELIHDILTTLRRNLDVPVTCKIRLLKSPQDTVELARRIEKTGVSALAVHGRKVPDRPRDPAKWNEIADVAAALSIPVIANGDVFEYEDFQRIRDATVQAHQLFLSMMLGSSRKAAGPMSNPPKCVIFGGDLTWGEVIFLRDPGNIASNSKVIIREMLLPQKYKTNLCASSVMVARGAIWNASIFSSEGKIPWEDVKREYVRKSILWDNDIRSTKHTLKEMIAHYSSLGLPEGLAVIKSDTSADLAKLYGEEEYYEYVSESRRKQMS